MIFTKKDVTRVGHEHQVAWRDTMQNLFGRGPSPGTMEYCKEHPDDKWCLEKRATFEVEAKELRKQAEATVFKELTGVEFTNESFKQELPNLIKTLGGGDYQRFIKKFGDLINQEYLKSGPPEVPESLKESKSYDILFIEGEAV